MLNHLKQHFARTAPEATEVWISPGISAPGCS